MATRYERGFATKSRSVKDKARLLRPTADSRVAKALSVKARAQVLDCWSKTTLRPREFDDDVDVIKRALIGSELTW